MDFWTAAMELLPCTTAAAWLWAWSLTWSTDAESCSTDALVSSSVAAWLCAPSESFWAPAEISALDEATCSAFCWTAATMSLSFSDIALRARARSPTSSFCWMPRRCVKSPAATSCANATPLASGRVMVRVIAMATAIPMRAAARSPTTRIITALSRRATARAVTLPASLSPDCETIRAASRTAWAASPRVFSSATSVWTSVSTMAEAL